MGFKYVVFFSPKKKWWFNHQGFRRNRWKNRFDYIVALPWGVITGRAGFSYPTSTWWYGEFHESLVLQTGFWYHDIILYCSSYFLRMIILPPLFGIMWLFCLNIDLWTTLVSKNWSMETIRCGQNYQNHHVVWSDEVSNPRGPSPISFSHTKTKDRRQSGFNRSPRAFQDFPPVSFTSKTG